MTISRSPKIRGRTGDERRRMGEETRALLRPFSGVTGKVRSEMLMPTNISAAESLAGEVARQRR
jgi:hypothetical protein